MFRIVLLLVTMIGTAQAAPQLKPIPDLEAIRIAALKAKYEKLRNTAEPDERNRLDSYAAVVRKLVELLELTKVSETANEVANLEGTLNRYINDDPALRDYYEIIMHERARKKAAAKK